MKARERPFRVAYIGWTGHDNIGDELGPIVFERSFRAHFGDRSTEFELLLEPSRWTTADATVACLGTLLAPYDYRNEWMTAFRTASYQGPLVGVGLGALPPPAWERWPTPAAYRNRFADWFDSLSVRGSHTAVQLGLPVHRVSGDSVFGIEWCNGAANGRRANSPMPVLAVNVGEWSRPLRNDAGTSLVDLVGAACEQLEAQFTILLFSMGKRDDAAVHSIAGRLRREPRCVFEREPFQLAAILAECDLGLTVKCHASGLLYASGVPTVNVAYQPKCLDLASVLSDSRYVLTPEALNTDDLIGAVRQLCDELPAQKRLLVQDVQRLRPAWQEHFRAAMQPVLAAMRGEYRRSRRLQRVRGWGAAVPAYGVAAARRLARRFRTGAKS